MPKKVLVTGADGFIGSHLVELLLKYGYDVRAFVQYNSLGSWGWLDELSATAINSLDVIQGDIRDPYFVESAVKGVDSVLHLAALIAIPYSYLAPASYIQTNVLGTLNVLESTKKFGTDKVVITSTSETYGSAQYVPITEEHSLNAQSPYAASKIAADQLALSYHRSFDMPVTILRPFNTYGPRQSVRAVIPTIITQLVAGQRSIKLGSLNPTRDFTHVTDTANGFRQVLESDKVVGEVINIGSSFEISIGKTVELICQIIGTDIEVNRDSQRIRPLSSEVERLFAGTEKASRLIGWKPSYSSESGFIKGLENTVEWFSNEANLAKYKYLRYNT